jgi:hypothetical protein
VKLKAVECPCPKCAEKDTVARISISEQVTPEGLGK